MRYMLEIFLSSLEEREMRYALCREDETSKPIGQGNFMSYYASFDYEKFYLVGYYRDLDLTQSVFLSEGKVLSHVKGANGGICPEDHFEAETDEKAFEIFKRRVSEMEFSDIESVIEKIEKVIPKWEKILGTVEGREFWNHMDDRQKQNSVYEFNRAIDNLKRLLEYYHFCIESK